MSRPGDRSETCPTCGSADAPRVCCPGTHAPDDHDATCEPCWDSWHDAAPPPAAVTCRECNGEWPGIDGCPECGKVGASVKAFSVTPAAVSATGRGVVVYRPASWKGQAPDDAKGRDDVPWVCRPASAVSATGREAENETLRRLLWRALEILEDEGFTVFPDEVKATLAALRRGGEG